MSAMALESPSCCFEIPGKGAHLGRVAIGHRRARRNPEATLSVPRVIWFALSCFSARISHHQVDDSREPIKKLTGGIVQHRRSATLILKARLAEHRRSDIADRFSGIVQRLKGAHRQR